MTTELTHGRKVIMIARSLSRASLYEQLAEEASELAQAASKLARILRKENPTPVSLNDAELHLIMELCDLNVVLETLDIYIDDYAEYCDTKLDRWVERLQKSERMVRDLSDVNRELEWSCKLLKTAIENDCSKEETSDIGGYISDLIRSSMENVDLLESLKKHHMEEYAKKYAEGMKE